MPVVTVLNYNNSGFSLNSLRAFRVLRPLRYLTKIYELQTLVQTVIFSLPLLKDTLIVLISFFIIFSVAGT